MIFRLCQCCGDGMCNSINLLLFVYLIAKKNKLEIIHVELTNQKALKPLMDMEELNLIKVLKKKHQFLN